MAIHAPPRTLNYEQRPRRVGVELEFGSLSPREASEAVLAVFGGALREVHSHSFVVDSQLGEFSIELDTRLLQSETLGPAREILGDIAALVVPCEVTCPPITLAEVARLDELVARLRRAGAVGTQANPLYAFSIQLNPDIATTDPTWIAAILKAYILLSDSLRREIALPLSRRILRFTEPFPQSFAERLLRTADWASIGEFIELYLDENPTRNRELDLLPLLAWFDEAKVRTRLPAEKIKPRPAFHYRLPNSLVDQDGWSLTVEWNRWRRVEQFAEEKLKLDRAADEFLRRAPA